MVTQFGEGELMRALCVLAVILALFVGCTTKQAEGEKCAKPEDCGPGLTCAEFVCRSPEAIKCRTSQGCIESGECTPKDGKCIAGSVADCTAFLACKDYGKCQAKDGKCIAGSDADCKASKACKLTGLLCNAKDGECAFVNTQAHQDCRASEDCLQYGMCFAKQEGGCFAALEEDCRASIQCRAFNNCTLREGWCQKK